MTTVQPTDDKVFLLDAYAIIYRSYYAFLKNPRINSKGVNTSAIFGFVNILDELIRNKKPKYIVPCRAAGHRHRGLADPD